MVYKSNDCQTFSKQFLKITKKHFQSLIKEQQNKAFPIAITFSAMYSVSKVYVMYVYDMYMMFIYYRIV